MSVFFPIAVVRSWTALNCILLLICASGAARADVGERNSYADGWQSSAKLSAEDDARLTDLMSRLKVAERGSDLSGEADLLNSIGLIHYKAEEFDDAIEAFTQALDLRRGLGDERGQATELAELGSTYGQKGMAREAIEVYQKCVPLWKRLDVAQEAAILGRIAEIFRQLGDRGGALHFNQQAEAAFEQAGDKAGRAAVLNNMGLAYFVTGDKKRGREYFGKALAAYHDAGNSLGEAAAQMNLAAGYSLSGDQAKDWHCSRAQRRCNVSGEIERERRRC
ncbi:tetratricopeptide repeat protein [Occallatibacter savannae]|uniref:tetratricopeptide repeat protein n=1 Tax=Occallatibacter savannae TaxID=1002691 RepID=UPI000D6928E6|nr:tetratricopeptide repeat protein [Occallatibacter savannae]